MRNFLRITNGLELRITNPDGGHIRNSQKFVIRRSVRPRAGFTLLEMVISLGIFAVVIVTAVGAMLAIGSAQTKSANVQNIQDNLRFALESMTKEIRTGTVFLGDLSVGSHAYQVLTFSRQHGGLAQYCARGGAMYRITPPSGTPCDPTLAQATNAITDDSITIDQLTFYLIGEGIGDGQPRITISITAHSTNPRLETKFRLETTVTPRHRETS